MVYIQEGEVRVKIESGSGRVFVKACGVYVDIAPNREVRIYGAGKKVKVTTKKNSYIKERIVYYEKHGD